MEKNLEKSLYWYQKAAENDSEMIQYYFALLCKNGRRTEKNLKRAFYWYRKSIETVQDNPNIKPNYEFEDDFNKRTKLIKPMKGFIIESKNKMYNKCKECHMRR